MMDFGSIEGLEQQGYSGFLAVQGLMDTACSTVPAAPGLYMVLNPTRAKGFLQQSAGGRFKGQDPTVTRPELEANWVDGALVLYIGKAGGPGSRANLRTRVGQYMRFGLGEAVGHWGGRLIWQLCNHRDLLVCWRAIGAGIPRREERDLIRAFAGQYGKRPFANLTG